MRLHQRNAVKVKSKPSKANCQEPSAAKSKNPILAAGVRIILTIIEELNPKPGEGSVV
jgi:hypothetical protein